MLLVNLLLINLIYFTTGYQFLFKENSSIDDIGTIYLRNIGDTKIFCRNRIIEFNIQIEDIEKIEREVESEINILKDICNRLKPNQLCRIEMEELNAIFQNLLNKNKIIISSNSKHHRLIRKVRNIDEMEQIVQKTIKLNDLSYGDIKQNIDELKKTSNKLMKSQSRTINSIDHINFNILSEITFSKLKKYAKFYDVLLELMIDENPEKLSNFVPLDELRMELNKLQDIMGKELCHIPIEITDFEIIKYLKKAKINTITLKNNLQITLQIPTFLKTTFNLIKAISIPFKYKGTSYIVKPVDPYHILFKKDYRRDFQAIPLSLEERSNCTTTTGYILCYPNRANLLFSTANIEKLEYIFKPEFPNCVNRHTANSEGMYDVCKLHRVPHINQIIRLNETDFFIYIIKRTNVGISCSQRNSVFNISESVLIRDLERDCSIFFGPRHLHGTK